MPATLQSDRSDRSDRGWHEHHDHQHQHIEISAEHGPFNPGHLETQIAAQRARQRGGSPASASGSSSRSRSRNGRHRTTKKATVQVGELALVAKVCEHGRKTCDHETAIESLTWALDVAGRGPTGLDERRPVLKLGPICRGILAIIVGSIAIFYILKMTRVGFREVSTRNGLMLAAGVPAYKGEEPLAAVAAPFQVRPLQSCMSLPIGTLRQMRDVAITHQGSWLNLRVAHVQKFSDYHFWVQAADGTGIRIRGGRLLFRDGMLGDEVGVEGGSDAKAYFEVIVEGASSS